MTNDEPEFVIRISSLIRHSSFVILVFVRLIFTSDLHHNHLRSKPWR